MSMKISKREKILLTIAAIVLLVGVYYRVVFSYQKDKLNALIQQKDEYDKKMQNINKQIALKNKTETDIKEINSKLKDMTSILFPSINQESFIVYVNKLLSDNNLEGIAMTFSDIKAVPVEEVKKDQKDDKTSSLKGVIDEYNGAPSKDNNTTNDKKTNNNNKTDNKDKPSTENISLNISFKGSYKNLLNFIKALETYPKKIIVSNLQISQSNTDEVTGNVQMEFYAIPKISDEDKDFFKWEYNNTYGKENPFDGKIDVQQTSSTIEQSGTTNKDQNYDFVMSVRPVNSDLPTVMLGRSKDYSKQSYVTADNPGITNVEMYLIQKDGKYYYRYKAGKFTFPPDANSDGEQFSIKGNNISIMIYSNKRVDKSDVSGVNLKIYNKTDKTVNITIDGDDNATPRVSVTGEGGGVDIKRN